VKQNEGIREKNRQYTFDLYSGGGSASGTSLRAGTSIQHGHGYGRRPVPDVDASRLGTAGDETGSDRDSLTSIRMDKDEGGRSTTHLETSSSTISRYQGQDYRFRYQQYHHFENYQRVERPDYPRQHKYHTHSHSHSHSRSRSQSQHQHQRQYGRVEVDVKPLLSSFGGGHVRSYPSSRSSSIQRAVYRSDVHSYSSTPAPRVYSSSERSSSEYATAHIKPDLNSLSGRYVSSLPLIPSPQSD
jgi:hypothetical protein